MKVYRGLEELKRPLSGGSLTIGNFDGVHVGHQCVIRGARRLANQTGGDLVVMTFDPHPLAVIHPDRAPALVTPLEYRLTLFERLGADVGVVLHSTPDLLSMRASRFVEEIISARFAPRHVVEGENFRFGAGREGTPDMLGRLGREFGFEMTVIPTFELPPEKPDSDPIRVNTSLVRQLLGRGEVALVARCLGRPHRLFGTPVRGQGRGRELGFPTVNLDTGEQLVAGHGVYAGRARVGDDAYPAAVSIGTCPTFNGDSLAVEVHLLDFDDNVGDRPLAVDMIERIRDQRRFDSPGELVEQMGRDVQRVRTLAATDAASRVAD